MYNIKLTNVCREFLLSRRNTLNIYIFCKLTDLKQACGKRVERGHTKNSGHEKKYYLERLRKNREKKKILEFFTWNWMCKNMKSNGKAWTTTPYMPSIPTGHLHQKKKKRKKKRTKCKGRHFDESFNEGRRTQNLLESTTILRLRRYVEVTLQMYQGVAKRRS